MNYLGEIVSYLMGSITGSRDDFSNLGLRTQVADRHSRHLRTRPLVGITAHTMEVRSINYPHWIYSQARPVVGITAHQSRSEGFTPLSDPHS